MNGDFRMKLIKIDLSKGNRGNHPDIVLGRFYLAKIADNWSCGKFSKQHYGFHFGNGFGACGGQQFDTPGSNCSKWQELYEISEENE